MLPFLAQVSHDSRMRVDPLPNSITSQGAAMAIEDAVVLAECLSVADSPQNITSSLRLYQSLRMDRVQIIAEGARETVHVWHLPDGPEQEARDGKLSRPASAAVEVRPGAKTNPNSWSDPVFQPWLFGFDAVADVRLPFSLQPLSMLT